MGVSTDIWRARIGAFLPIARKMSSRERPVGLPSRSRRRACRKPKEKPKTQHSSIMAMFSMLLILLLGASCFDRQLRTRETHVTVLDFMAVTSLLVHIGTSRMNNKIQEKLAMTIQFIIFLLSLLLLCGDIESNPGPKGTVSIVHRKIPPIALYF